MTLVTVHGVASLHLKCPCTPSFCSCRAERWMNGSGKHSVNCWKCTNCCFLMQEKPQPTVPQQHPLDAACKQCSQAKLGHLVPKPKPLPVVFQLGCIEKSMSCLWFDSIRHANCCWIPLWSFRMDVHTRACVAQPSTALQMRCNSLCCLQAVSQQQSLSAADPKKPKCKQHKDGESLGNPSVFR